MDLMELGALGELVGGVAVVATLLYLAAQVRQGTKQAAASLMLTTVGNFNRNHEIVLANPDHARLLAKLRTTTNLDPTEQEQAAAYTASLMNTWQGAENAFNLGLMNRQTFDMICEDAAVMLRQRPGLTRFARQILDDYPQRKSFEVFQPILRESDPSATASSPSFRA